MPKMEEQAGGVEERVSCIKCACAPRCSFYDPVNGQDSESCQRIGTTTPPPKWRPRVDGGTKYDSGKPQIHLLPYGPLSELARLYEVGCIKYGFENWKGGFDDNRLWNAAQRHLWAWKEGEKKDPETGMSHLVHALWNVTTLLYQELKREKSTHKYYL